MLGRRARQALSIVAQWQMCSNSSMVGPALSCRDTYPVTPPAALPFQPQLRTHQTSATGHSHRSTTSVDPKEAAKFAQLADEWWRAQGPFAPLHRMNPTRCRFIRDTVCAMHGLDPAAREPFLGLRVLDVGCGGGILSESMTRLGATTTGIDVTEQNVLAATAHAMLDPLVKARVRYQCTSLEALVGVSGEAGAETSAQGDTGSGSQQALYDVVLASEVIEHVRRPDVFVQSLARAVAPGGSLIVSTINRTPASWAVVIAGAEYLTGMVPRGTHDWHKFITPQELYLMAKGAGLSMAHAAGMGMDLGRGSFACTDDLSVNYIAAFHKPAEPLRDATVTSK